MCLVYVKEGIQMEVNKVENIVPQYKQIPSGKPGVKRYEQGDLIKEVDKNGKKWIFKPTGKVVAKGPLTQDVFEKEQPVDLEGKVVNKNGVINN